MGDSAVVREALTQIINSDPRLSVMASAADPFRAAALAGPAKLRPLPRRAPEKKLTADAVFAPAAPRKAMSKTTEKIIAVGASTGGTEALRVFLENLPRDAPPVVIVQHMPEGFISAFAKRLNTLCAVDVAKARDDDRLLRGARTCWA